MYNFGLVIGKPPLETSENKKVFKHKINSDQLEQLFLESSLKHFNFNRFSDIS